MGGRISSSFSAPSESKMPPSSAINSRKIELPLETWCELLGFLPRPYLSQIAPHIRSRQLAAIIQFFLHRYGAVKLGELQIEQWGVKPVVRKWKSGGGGLGPFMPIDADPANEMPENIKDFRALTLSHFDDTVIGWLQKFAHRHLLTNVHLHVPRYTKDAFFALLPLLESIESVSIPDQHVLANICAANGDDDEQQMGGWLARVRMLKFCISCRGRPPRDAGRAHIDRICRWLYSAPPHPNGPRALLLSFFGNDSVEFYVKWLLERFEKDFINAAECASFFIRLQLCSPQPGVECKSLQNARTKEMFSIKVAADNGRMLLISRLPAQANSGWIAEKEREVLEWDLMKQSRRIHLKTN